MGWIPPNAATSSSLTPFWLKPQLRFKRLTDTAQLPEKHLNAAGYDLFADRVCSVPPLGKNMIHTGVAVELPVGTAGFVQPRSGLAAGHGITVLNSPGLVDEDYRGELKVILHNTNRINTFYIEPGDKIAQLVIQKVENNYEPIFVHELSETKRGKDGFGSSDKKFQTGGIVNDGAR